LIEKCSFLAYCSAGPQKESIVTLQALQVFLLSIDFVEELDFLLPLWLLEIEKKEKSKS